MTVMIDATFFSPDKKILVVGAGSSGMAALHLLGRQGCQLAVSDGGPLERLGAAARQWLADHDVVQEFGGHRAATFCCAHGIVVSPGVPLDLPELVAARDRGIPILGELELGSLFIDAKVVAVTGTNGKTTVTTMIGELLAAAGHRVFVGGNIGTPLCQYVVSGEEADVVVLEVSSFQLDTAHSFRPHIGVLLNVSPDHLDRYDSYAGYIDAKMRLFHRQRRHDFAVINGDDPEINKRLGSIPSTIREFGSKKNCQARMSGGAATVTLAEQETECYTLPEAIGSAPNCDNALAAILVARLMGCPPAVIERGLAAFRCLEHRLTPVATVAGVTYIDDSKATNIGALQSALAGMRQPVHLIAGGRDKGGDYHLVSREIEAKVENLIVLGEAAEMMAEAWGSQTTVHRASTMAEAVRVAAGLATEGEVVLLSPACASFDMFNSYVERGRAFQEAVAELEQGGSAAADSRRVVLRKAV